MSFSLRLEHDVPRPAWSNLVLVGALVFFFPGYWLFAPETVSRMGLGAEIDAGLLLHPLLHRDLATLVFNAAFLLIFGGPLSRFLGPWLFAATFLGAAVAAGATHSILDGTAAVGADGTLAGIAGCYLACFLGRNVEWTGPRGTLAIPTIALVLLWLGLDLCLDGFGIGAIATFAQAAAFVVGLTVGALGRALAVLRQDSELGEEHRPA